MSKKIYVIIANSRPHWLGREIARWVKDIASKNTNFEYQIVDLESYRLPFLPKRWKYSFEDQDSSVWHNKFSDAAGLIFVTPEHNGRIPKVFKRALSYLKNQWSHRPVAFVSYGYLSGNKIISELKRITKRLNMLPVDEPVQIADPWEAMNPRGEFGSKDHERNLLSMLHQFSQWVMHLNPQQA